MWGLVGGAPDLRDTSVGGHDHDRRLVALQCSIKEGEALDVEHVDLVDEENTRDDLGTALFAPLSDLLVNLFAHLGLDLTDITSEERHEALSARVNNIDLVKCHGVNDFLTLLKLTLWALNKSGLRTDIVEVRAAGEGATQLGDLATCLVDSNDISSHDLLLGDGLNHLCSEVIDGLHLSRFERNLASLCAASHCLVDLDVAHLSLNDLGFLSDAHT